MSEPQQQGEPKKGLSTGCLAALIVVGIILLIFGVCVAVLNANA